MRRPDDWGEAFANMRQIARDNPRAALSVALTPVRIGLMVATIRAWTHAGTGASFAALVSVALAWAAVEYGVSWATKEPDRPPPLFVDDDYRVIGAECEPMTGTEPEWVAMCDCDPRGDLCHRDFPDDAIQALVGRCSEDCRPTIRPCDAIVVLKIGARELGRGPWVELRQTEAAQEFLEIGGPAAETMMRTLDLNLGVQSHKDRFVN